MDLLALVVLAAFVGTLFVARVMVWSSNQAAEGAITRYFKASEYILNTGEPPPEWRVVPWRRRLTGRADAAARDEEILARLDDLVRFFEACRFFEDEWTREQLIMRLSETRAAWQARETL